MPELLLNFFGGDGKIWDLLVEYARVCVSEQ